MRRGGAARPRGGRAHALLRDDLPPGAHADTDELVAVAEEAAPFGAPLVPHVRNEGAGVLEAIGEFVDVARGRRAAPPRT